MLPPFFAFLAARALIMFAALASGVDALSADAFLRWDANQYLSIAQRGYYLVDCAHIGYPASGWCGNAGWMPAYPGLVALVAGMSRLPLPTTALLLSALFELALLTIAWDLLGRRGFLTLLACALAPGMVYHHAAFPISMCAFLIALTVWLLLRSRWTEAGTSGAIAAATYSTGVLVAPIAAFYAAAVSSERNSRARQITVTGGLAMLGLIGVFAVHQVTVGAWDAFLRVQAKYGHGVFLPSVTWLRAVQPLWTGQAPRAPAIEAGVVGVGMIGLIAWRGRKGVPERDALLLGTATAYWLVPLIVGGVSLYRADSLIFPAILLLATAPRWLNASVCLGLAVLGFFMSRLFFQGVLI